MASKYWKHSREATVQVIDQKNSETIVTSIGFVAIREIIAREQCPYCHSFNIPVILNDGEKVMGIHRRFGTDFDCEGFLLPYHRRETPVRDKALERTGKEERFLKREQ